MRLRVRFLATLLRCRWLGHGPLARDVTHDGDELTVTDRCTRCGRGVTVTRTARQGPKPRPYRRREPADRPT